MPDSITKTRFTGVVKVPGNAASAAKSYGLQTHKNTNSSGSVLTQRRSDNVPPNNSTRKPSK